MKKEKYYGGFTHPHSRKDNLHYLADIFIKRMEESLHMCYPKLRFAFRNNVSSSDLCDVREAVTLSVFTDNNVWIFRVDLTMDMVIGNTFFDSFVYICSLLNRVLSRYVRDVL